MLGDLRKRLASQGHVLNGWLTLPSGVSAELMAHAGFDSLTVDLQHGLQDFGSLLACFQGAMAAPVSLLSRVPWLDAGIIGKVLDAGSQGVICPMINTREDAEAFVAACRYPPTGKRSFGPVRVMLESLSMTPAGFARAADRDVVCLPMIETAEAIENLDSILDAPGVDGVYVGPADLGLSLGLGPRQDRDEPEILNLFDDIVRATASRGLVAGVHATSGAYAARMLGMGFRLVTVASDNSLILNGARAQISAARVR